MEKDLIIEKLLEIKKCPGMYLGKPELSRLHMYIAGYALREMEIIASQKDLQLIQPKESLLNGFDSFVNEYYDDRRGGAGWDFIIRLYEKDEERALNKFYELLDVYLKKCKYFD